MKILGKLWWLFTGAMVAVTFLNPYIGFFGFFQIVELFFLSILTLNIVIREKVVKKNPENTITKRLLKSMKVTGIIVSPVFLALNTFVDLTIFKLATEQNRIATPVDFLSVAGNKDGCQMMLIVALVLNVVCAIAYICRMRNINTNS